MIGIKQIADFGRRNFKGVVLLSILGLLTYLRVSTEDKYFDSVSEFCVASNHNCIGKLENHAFVIENQGTPQEVSICLENGRKCVRDDFVWSYDSPASSDVLMSSSLPNYRDNIFPHSTLILCLAPLSLILGALFDHGSICGDVVQDERHAFSSSASSYAIRKIVLCLDIVVFSFIIASATQFYYDFNERCDRNDAKELCDYLASEDLRIVSIIDTNNIFFENYRICFIVLDVALLFATLLNVRTAFGPSRSDPVAVGDDETSAAEPSATPYLVDPQIGAKAMLVHSQSVQTRRYIAMAARSSKIVSLGPEQTCSICLARLLVSSEISTEIQLNFSDTRRQYFVQSNAAALRNDSSVAAVQRASAQTVTGAELTLTASNQINNDATPPPLSPRSRDNKVVELPCKHCFHYACIKKWVDSGVTHVNCPECRHPIVESAGLI